MDVSVGICNAKPRDARGRAGAGRPRSNKAERSNNKTGGVRRMAENGGKWWQNSGNDLENGNFMIKLLTKIHADPLGPRGARSEFMINAPNYLH